jgi:hypothetical protein
LFIGYRDETNLRHAARLLVRYLPRPHMNSRRQPAQAVEDRV